MHFKILLILLKASAILLAKAMALPQGLASVYGIFDAQQLDHESTHTEER